MIYNNLVLLRVVFYFSCTAFFNLNEACILEQLPFLFIFTTLFLCKAEPLSIIPELGYQTSVFYTAFLFVLTSWTSVCTHFLIVFQ